MTAVRRIALVGLPGSGKSTVAPLLAGQLGWTCVDLDDEVTARSGRTPAAILEADGEAAFRAIELTALVDVLNRTESTVIACGGGLITGSAARTALTEHCDVVWLDAPDSVLIERLADALSRPLLAGSAATSIPRLRADRFGAHQVAGLRMLSEDEPEVIAATLASALRDAVAVDLGERTYNVEIRPGALEDVVMHLPASAMRVGLIADRAVQVSADRLVASLRSAGIATTVLPVDGGEAIKTWAAAGQLLDHLGAAGLQRNDCLIALGGGTVGDLAGFVAATYLRGIAWLNVPTTLLAMVDSAVGGKTGVNLTRGKNLAGAFWQPRAVVCDPDLLASQDDRSFRSAFAEIVKYSMIVDTTLVGDLDAHLDGLLGRDPTLLAAAVRESCAIKARIVSADERETGLRAILNYGHTAGHALEAAAGFGDVLHGEAVAVGMRVAGRLSSGELGCPAGDIEWQDEMIERCGLPTALVFDLERVLGHMRADKKAVGDELGWVLLEGRGEPQTGRRVAEPAVRDALKAVLTQ